MVCDDEQDAFDIVAEIRAMPPGPCSRGTPCTQGFGRMGQEVRGLEELVPSNPNRPDMRDS